MSKMTPQEIEEYIEEWYPKVKDLCDAIGMTKEQWIEEAIRGPKKQFMRCENCKNWPCVHIENLKKDYPLFIPIWYEYGCNCHLFDPKEMN